MSDDPTTVRPPSAGPSTDLPAPSPVEDQADEYAASTPAEPRVPIWVLASLSVLVVALLIGAIIGGLSWQHRQAAASDERAAIAVGRQTALNVFSFDYHKVADQLGVIQRDAGGRFATEFTNSRAALIKVVTTEQRVSSSRVVQVGVVSSTSSDVQLVLALNEFRVTKADPKGVPILQRVFLELRKTSGHWKLIDLRPVA